MRYSVVKNDPNSYLLYFDKEQIIYGSTFSSLYNYLYAKIKLIQPITSPKCDYFCYNKESIAIDPPGKVVLCLSYYCSNSKKYLNNTLSWSLLTSSKPDTYPHSQNLYFNLQNRYTYYTCGMHIFSCLFEY